MSGVSRVDRVADFSDAERDALRALALAVYPPEEFANAPGRALEWAPPEWGVRLYGDDGVLLSYVGVVRRDARRDDTPVRVGGIGSVKTHPAARGRGLAARGVRRAIDFFHDPLGVDFALLVCQPHLLDYYAGFGWREFHGRLVVRQRGETVDFTLNRVMTLAVRAAAPAIGTLDLLGPPW